MVIVGLLLVRDCEIIGDCGIIVGDGYIIYILVDGDGSNDYMFLVALILARTLGS